AAQRQARRDAPHHGPSEYLSRVTVQLPRELSVSAVIPEDAEHELKSKMHPEVREIMKDKRLLLLAEVARAAWKETLEQKDKKWLREKTRAVDDLSEFLINASVTETDKVILDAVDSIVATARFLVGSPCEDGESFRLPCSDGSSFSGFLHDDFRGRGRSLQLYGRALDLKAAYKQLARHPEDAWATVLAVLCPEDDRVYFFEAVALPFGGVSAAAERFLALLGWEIARGDKLKPFSPSFNILGVTVSFDRSTEGVINVSNKQERLPDLWRLLLQMESDPGLRLDTLASFKGRMLFATSHVFGRCAQICTQLIGKALKAARPEEARDHVLKAARLALEVLSEAGPREVLRWGEAPPVLVFADGACEKDGTLTTHGAVLLDPVAGVQELFGERVPDFLVQRWQGQGLKQLVFFAELLPVAVAKATWQHILKNRLCIFFLDNEAARACLIRSFTPVANATSILMDVAKQDVAAHSLNWYSRVPSKSNIADDASRLDFSRYANLFRVVQPVYDSIT
ncbi:unnamed protein product, partial [Symbiodinium microadriaticum]